MYRNGNFLLQLLCYSGKYKGHVLGYQVVSGPDGIVYDLFGREPGRENDLTLLRLSELVSINRSTSVIN